MYCRRLLLLLPLLLLPLVLVLLLLLLLAHAGGLFLDDKGLVARSETRLWRRGLFPLLLLLLLLPFLDSFQFLLLLLLLPRTMRRPLSLLPLRQPQQRWRGWVQLLLLLLLLL